MRRCAIGALCAVLLSVPCPAFAADADATAAYIRAAKVEAKKQSASIQAKMKMVASGYDPENKAIGGDGFNVVTSGRRKLSASAARQKMAELKGKLAELRKEPPTFYMGEIKPGAVGTIRTPLKVQSIKGDAEAVVVQVTRASVPDGVEQTRHPLTGRLQTTPLVKMIDKESAPFTIRGVPTSTMTEGQAVTLSEPFVVLADGSLQAVDMEIAKKKWKTSN